MKVASGAWLLVLFVLLSTQSVLSGQDRSDFVSDASHTVGTYQPAESGHSPAEQVKAAMTLVDSLNEELKDKMMMSIDSAERRAWTNLPAPADAGGVRLGDLNKAQIQAACDLMASLFSPQGYQKMVSIMLADDQLLNGGRPRRGFGTENFSIVIFGTPSETEPWAFQLDGHHVGVNVSLSGKMLTMSPSFIGTQPQSFDLAGKSIRPLTGEIDDAYRLVGELNDEQRKEAVIRNRRDRILTGPGNDNLVPESVGLPCSKMNEDQQKILFALIARWTEDLPKAHAERRMEQIKSELDEMKFSWNGETEVGSDISYRIQSPSLIIEYACQNLGGDPQQHLHTMYRDPTNEYGGQIGAVQR